MIRKLSAIFFAAIFIIMMVPVPAMAAGDTTPPVLNNVTFDKTILSEGDTLTITVDATDTESGISPWQCWIDIANDETGLGIYTVNADYQDSKLVFRFTVDSSCPSGNYTLSSITLRDKADNPVYFSRKEGTLPRDMQLHVSIQTSYQGGDTEGPHLDAFNVSQYIASVGDTIQFNVNADDPSGVQCCNIFVINVRYFWTTIIKMETDPNNPCHFMGSLQISGDMYEDDYMLYIVLSDTKYNSSNHYANKLLHVNNPENIFHYSKPIITDFTMDSTVKAGDAISFTAKIDMNGLKCNSSDLEVAYLSLGRDGYNSAPGDYNRGTLTRTGDGIYSGTFDVPPTWTDKKYNVGMFFMLGSSTLGVQWPDSYYDQNGKFLPPSFTPQSVFSGTDNVSIPLGTSFDKMAGVTAGNITDGDLTGKIEASGNVDTSRVGVYLVKYKAPMSRERVVNGYSYSSYDDYRWVGVTEIAPDPSAGSQTLVVTDGSVAIGADSADVSLTKDGKNITYAASVADPGKYDISLTGGGDSGSATSKALRSSENDTGKSGKAGFIIDQEGPGMSAQWTGNSDGKRVDVSIACSDPSGVAETKWLPGTLSVADFKDAGNVFDSSFTVDTFGSYTVYTRDNLGYESVKTFTIQHVNPTMVSLNHSSAKITAGYSLQLTPSVSPSNATFKGITWTSSNPAVATVDGNGLVQAVAPGTAKITAVLTDGGKSADCIVKVLPPVAVKSVRISRRSVSVYLGSSYKLSASVSPSNATVKTITWSSSDNSVATVDSTGRINALAVGTATIFATANNGKVAACKVTVKPIPVTKVSMSRSSAKLTVGATLVLTATVRPLNATYKGLTWYSNKPSVATVDGNGNVVAVSKGTAYIYAKANNGKYARCKVVVK